jgi:hypothetical protein
VPSWNATRPPGSWIRVELRVAERAGAPWSEWFDLGCWGSPGGAPSQFSEQEGWGKVDEDTLQLNRPVTMAQWRLTLHRGEEGWPVLRLVGLCAADTRAGLLPPPQRAVGQRATRLQVPYRSQRIERPAISGRICGPTSLAMALAYFGCERATEQVAEAAWDQRNEIYGNWPFLAAAAGELGFRAWVTRCRSLTNLEAEVEAGHPVILSYAYGRGELDNTPLKSTSGHLLLVTGFTAGGDVCVNDPAGHAAADGQCVYRRDQVERIWLSRGGVCIFIHPRGATE